MNTSRLALTASVAFIAVALSGCSAGACSSGASSAVEAAHGLVEASLTADDPQDICRFTSDYVDYDQSDVEALAQRFAEHDPEKLTYKVVDQMGSDATVGISTENGTLIGSFDLTSNQDGQWTIYFGPDFPK